MKMDADVILFLVAALLIFGAFAASQALAALLGAWVGWAAWAAMCFTAALVVLISVGRAARRR